MCLEASYVVALSTLKNAELKEQATKAIQFRMTRMCMAYDDFETELMRLPAENLRNKIQTNAIKKYQEYLEEKGVDPTKISACILALDNMRDHRMALAHGVGDPQLAISLLLPHVDDLNKGYFQEIKTHCNQLQQQAQPQLKRPANIYPEDETQSKRVKHGEGDQRIITNEPLMSNILGSRHTTAVLDKPNSTSNITTTTKTTSEPTNAKVAEIADRLRQLRDAKSSGDKSITATTNSSVGTSTIPITTATSPPKPIGNSTTNLNTTNQPSIPTQSIIPKISLTPQQQFQPMSMMREQNIPTINQLSHAKKEQEEKFLSSRNTNANEDIREKDVSTDKKPK